MDSGRAENANLLNKETSPYLLQHRDNPVHWRPWGEGALEQAKKEGKPILLSIGYSACHWCHVMAHESFEDEDIAAYMNEHFVNIKVDREERPDLDLIYQSALGLMGEQGGWPLTMFLTPDGEPYWGGTYFPPQPRYGRPGFAELLSYMASAYHRERGKVLENSAAMTKALKKLSEASATSPEKGTLTQELLQDTAEHLLAIMDPIQGGTRGRPKFPQVSIFRFLWHMFCVTGKEKPAKAVHLLLERMSQGGIYDHLGGGYARYSTDETWLAPHFEKMLYDNAQILELLADTALSVDNPLYIRRAEETVQWMLTDMKVEAEGEEGFAFAAALDADSEGEEGRYYVWTEDEVDNLLGKDSAAFKRVYDVSSQGNWHEGGAVNILNRNTDHEARAFGPDSREEQLSRSRAILLIERRKRIAPERDDKVLADWNGMAIAALARAGNILDRPEWIESAGIVFSFISKHLVHNGRFGHSWRWGELRHAAVLDDYAHMVRAALALYEATGNTLYLEQGRSWTETVHGHYWDEGEGGYFLSADDTTDVISRPKTIADNAQPSGNGVMAENLARLFLLTGDEKYRERAETIIDIFSGPSARHLTNLPGLLSAHLVLQHALQIVIIGDNEQAGLTRTVIETAPPWRTLSRIEAGSPLPEGNPAHGKTDVDKPTVYICAGSVCGLPLTTPEDLRNVLLQA